MKWAWIIFICLVSAGHTGFGADYSIQNGKTSCQIPFKTYNDLIVVDLSINKERTLKFIFDSGCKNTIVIKPSLLDSFSIRQNTRLYFSGLGSNDSVEVIKYLGCTLELGDLTGTKLSVYNLSKDYLNFENYLGVDVDGIFGAELFEKFYIHINYKTHLIELSEIPPKKINSHYKIHVDVRSSKGYIQTLVKTKSGLLHLVDLLIDTGANLPLIIKNEDPENLEVSQYIEAEVGEGLSGPVYAKVGRVAQLYLGNHHFDSIICAFHENAIYTKDQQPNFISGNIGNELLNRFDTYFAFPDSCMYIRPRGNLYKPFEFHLINIILKEDKSPAGNFVIKSIATQTAPYLAGLRSEDQLISINRYNCKDIEMEDAISLLNKRIGKKVKIKYIRDNKAYICTYIIQPII